MADEENSDADRFNSLAEQDDPGIIREFIWFLRYNKKWWLAPIVLALLTLVVFAIFSSSPVGPFIYTLF